MQIWPNQRLYNEKYIYGLSAIIRISMVAGCRELLRLGVITIKITRWQYSRVKIAQTYFGKRQSLFSVFCLYVHIPESSGFVGQSTWIYSTFCDIRSFWGSVYSEVEPSISPKQSGYFKEAPSKDCWEAPIALNGCQKLQHKIPKRLLFFFVTPLCFVWKEILEIELDRKLHQVWSCWLYASGLFSL